MVSLGVKLILDALLHRGVRLIFVALLQAPVIGGEFDQYFASGGRGGVVWLAVDGNGHHCRSGDRESGSLEVGDQLSGRVYLALFLAHARAV